MSKSSSNPNGPRVADSAPAGGDPGAGRIAIDIGATKTVVAYYRGAAPEPLDRFLTPEEPEAALEAIARAVAGAPAPAREVGIGAPGPLDPVGGVILEPPNLRRWWGFPLKERLEAELQLPVTIDNDATVGALGEAVFGSGRGYSSVYYITISTGIGAGLVIDGSVFGGHAGLAGEVHAFRPGNFAGRNDGWNVIDLASGPGLIRRTRHGLKQGAESSLTAEDLDTRKILAALEENDPLAVEIMEDARNAMAAVVMGVLYAVAPEIIVLAGGLCTDNRWYVTPVQERVRDWLAYSELQDIPIARAELWDSAVLWGASVLSEERRFGSRRDGT